MESKEFGEFLRGQATGYGGTSAWGQMGADLYRDPAAIAPVRRPKKPGPVVPGFVPESPAQREARLEREAAQARRAPWLNALRTKPGLLDRAQGKVCTFLDDDGDPIIDARGGFVPGEIVSGHEHRRRLAHGYKNFWRRFLKGTERSPANAVAIAQAERRLAWAQRGIFVAPTDRQCNDFMINAARGKVFATLRTAMRLHSHKVGIREYDRRMRMFLERTLEGRWHSLKLGGRLVSDMGCNWLVYSYFAYPHLRRWA